MTIIAIDGPSASGKGTISKKLAAHFDFAHLDTGLLYRAVGVAVLTAGAEPSDPEIAETAALALAESLARGPGEKPLGQSLLQTHLDKKQSLLVALDYHRLMEDPMLRGDVASRAASQVGSIASVRAALLQFQRNYCAAPPMGKLGAVLDGRDIGTVIAPGAEVKIFVTASAEARALRRAKELEGRGQQTHYEDVLREMRARDARDSERTIAPTKAAIDAVTLDTTNLDAAASFQAALDIATEKLRKLS